MERIHSKQSRHISESSLPIVHMFWHGAPLSRVERMCMASFVACGHEVQLHIYDEPARVPSGVRLVDANAVIPRDALFRHAKSGSMAQFADWFRYRVLHQQGGVWADTDVVCLRSLEYSRPEVFAWQDDKQINNAILGLPAGHHLAAWMASVCEHPNRVLPYDTMRVRWRKWKRTWLQGDRRNNVKWGEYGPVGFTVAARHFGYADLALPPHHFYPVPYLEWRRVFDEREAGWDTRLANSKALHLWNEMMRREADFDKNARFAADSLFEQLCARYLKDDN